MKNFVLRKNAVLRIAEREISSLRPAQRESLIGDWWFMDEDDPEFRLVPEELRIRMRKCDPPDDCTPDTYNPLILIGLAASYRGVRNSYLETKLSEYEGEDIRVLGKPEELFGCPCCGYRSLEKRCEYFICRVCFWEDDCSETQDAYSSCNRMTLEEAENNFFRFGAVSEEAFGYVDKEGELKYMRDDLCNQDIVYKEAEVA
ncbi:MAG: hypothetical protein DRI57_03965 [Deltaproteobacteria bacterium]|nr:MAG: hypothetical protein DRI57_03965 [Deltaproteobacteria bacterium]